MTKRFTALAGTREGSRHGHVCLASAPQARAIWMETMYLVAGLAVAGLAGIAAAFYFSIRAGKGGNKRLRPAGAGRSGTDDTGPDPALDFGDPGLIGGRRGSRRFEPDETEATNPGLIAMKTSEPTPATRSAARLSDETEDTARPRRRMGFRKGADVDEELWPTEAFGGVSDEQFWDDLAADKPLTTTARTAQQDSGSRKRPPRAGPATGEGRRSAGSGTYPEPRTAPSPATERTMVQPGNAATQPVPRMTPQIPGARQVPRASQVPAATQALGATQPVKTATGGSQPTTATRQPVSAAGAPSNIASRPAGAPAQPTEARGRRRASSAEEDPLTSAAFSLRPSGPVDGRSSLRAGGSRSGGSAPGSAGAYGDTSPGSPYPPAGASYGDRSSVTQAANTPPRGENYGYGSRGSAPAGDDARRPNGTRSHARPTGPGQNGQGAQNGQGTRPARHAYPQVGYPAGNRPGTGGYQGAGGYPAPVYPGNGYPGSGYPGNGGHPGNIQGAPYDPREDYRRLTQRR